MHEYQAPLADMRFVLRELVDLDLLAQLPGFADMSRTWLMRCWRRPANSPLRCCPH